MKLKVEAKWEDGERAKADAISFWPGPRDWVRSRGCPSLGGTVDGWGDESETTHGSDDCFFFPADSWRL